MLGWSQNIIIIIIITISAQGITDTEREEIRNLLRKCKLWNDC